MYCVSVYTCVCASVCVHVCIPIPPTFLCRIIYLPPVPQYLDSLGVTKVQNSDIAIVEAQVKFLGKDQLVLHFQDGCYGTGWEVLFT